MATFEMIISSMINRLLNILRDITAPVSLSVLLTKNYLLTTCWLPFSVNLTSAYPHIISSIKFIFFQLMSSEMELSKCQEFDAVNAKSYDMKTLNVHT